MRKLGYGQGEATPFDAWEVPTGKAYFLQSHTEGELTYDEFGLTDPFVKIATNTEKDKDIDPGSTFLRITNNRTGTRVLVVGDPRGKDVAQLRTEMGAEFGKLFDGIHVIEGFQHHTGTMGAGDPEGLSMIMQEVLARNGEVTIVDQSQLEPYGKQTAQFLNSSLMEAARQLGVTYEVALTPDPDNPATFGTIVIDEAGNVTSTGGNIRRIEGDPAVRARTQRYVELTVAARELSANKELLSNPQAVEQQIAELAAARDALGDALGIAREGNATPNGLIQLVLAGVAKDNARAQAALTNQPAVDAAKANVLRTHPGEAVMQQETMRSLVQFMALHHEQFPNLLRNLKRMRETGEVTDELVEDMVDLLPHQAEAFFAHTEMTPEARQELEQKVEAAVKAGATAKFTPTTKGAAVGMIGLQLWNDVIGPGLALWQWTSEMEDVEKFRNIIRWWNGANVRPRSTARSITSSAATSASRTPR